MPLRQLSNVQHLYGSNPHATAILCMFRLDHNKLNIDGHDDPMCQRNIVRTGYHVLFEYHYTVLHFTSAPNVKVFKDFCS